MLVRDLMSTPVITVSSDTPVGDGLEIMKKNNVHRLAVVDENGGLLGVASEANLLRIFPKFKEKNHFEYNLISRTPISQVMITDPIYVNPDMTVEEAALIIKTHRIGCLPVIEDNKVIGVLTRTNVFEVFINSMGLGKEGLRLTISYKKTLGFLADLIKVADKVGAIIEHLVTFENEVVLKVSSDTAKLFVQELKKAGFNITDVTCVDESSSKPCA